MASPAKCDDSTPIIPALGSQMEEGHCHSQAILEFKTESLPQKQTKTWNLSSPTSLSCIATKQGPSTKSGAAQALLSILNRTGKG